ncbi:MAG: ferric reductase-like transmembrane domain-containing protein [Candidatus Omnitrophota bacterium]
MGAYGALTQFLLLSGAPWIERAFGLDRLTRLHRYNAVLTISAVLSHPLLVLAGYCARDGEPVLGQLRKLFGWEGVVAAAVAYGLLVIVGLTSWEKIRRRLDYEVWFRVHWLVYAAVLLAFVHQIEVGSDLSASKSIRWYWIGLSGFALGSFLLYRWIRPWFYLARYEFYVDKIIAETSDVTSVYIAGKNLDRFRIRPGQFMILRFLSVPFWTQAHPFSLSTESHTQGLRVSIKALGDFTRRIGMLEAGTPVLIDGPYGIFTAPRAHGERVLLIAGGIGITPLRSLAGEMAAAGKDTVLLYSSRNLAATALKDELDAIGEKFKNFKVLYVMDQDPGWTGPRGKLTEEAIRALCPDAASREVFLCGPPMMMQALIGSLVKIGTPVDKIYYEKFSL